MRVIAGLQEIDAAWGGVLIPTMGALHEGHEALIRAGAARAGGRPCVVSIFVNPTQFNQPSDYNRYPRTLESDLAACERAGATLVFAPIAEVMYPPGETVPVPVLPAVATCPGLEDRFRPGHFAGVCQVVARLFRLLRPDEAVFGEKDWQQLQVVTAMTASEGLGVYIVPYPTVREPDGLAMSSRNRFLSPEERRGALAISRALRAAAGERGMVEERMAREFAGAPLRVEYAVVRDGATLGPVVRGRPARALIAAWAGPTRLIDNAACPGSD
jgi:pantoate--beta-alanine ligase